MSPPPEYLDKSHPTNLDAIRQAQRFPVQRNTRSDVNNYIYNIIYICMYICIIFIWHIDICLQELDQVFVFVPLPMRANDYDF
jgi:hypothetical protein